MTRRYRDYEAIPQSEPTEDGPCRKEQQKGGSEVYMERHMGFLRAIGVIVNSVIGTGIFLSPTGIAKTVGSVGATLLTWFFCGIVSLLLALVYTELGTMLPKAGGPYAFVLESFGPMLAFSLVWFQIFAGASNVVIMGRTVGQYLFSFAFPRCGVPYVIKQLATPVVALAFVYINCKNILTGARIQTAFSAVKMASLLIISVSGIVLIVKGHTDNLDPMTSFAYTRMTPGSLAEAVLYGIFSYSSWDVLFFIQEEVKQPEWTIPLVCSTSMLLITVIYVLTNISYFTVMTVPELVASPAVAVTFAERGLSSLSWIMSPLVSLSAAGSINSFFIGTSRLVFSVGRQGSLPRKLGMLHNEYNSPVPAIIFLFILSCVYMPVVNIYDIMLYSTFMGIISYMLTISSWFYFWWKKPNIHRPFKVPVVIPVVLMVVLAVITIFAFTQSPVVYGIGLAVYMSAFPVYILDKYLLSRSHYVTVFMDTMTIFCQRLLGVVPEQRNESEL